MNSTSRDRKELFNLVLTCLFVLLARESNWLTESVRLIPPISECVLSPETVWQIPASAAGYDQLLSGVHYLLFSLACSILIAASVIRFSEGMKLIPILAAICLSASIQPNDLIPAALIFAIAIVSQTQRFTGKEALRWTLIVALGFGGILISLEFGIVLLFVTYIWAIHSSAENSRASQTLGSILGVVFVCACWIRPDFLSAFLRPISWTWLQVPLELIPSLTSPLLTPQMRPAVSLFLLVGGLLWWAAEQAYFKHVSTFLYLISFSILALGTSHYFFLSSFLLFLILSQFDYRSVRVLNWGHSGIVFTLMTLGFAVWQTDKLTLLAGEAAPQFVDPEEWNIEGNVLLMNLDHTKDWNGNDTNDFRLVLDNRWDVFASEYRNYLALCRDLRDVRINNYLMTNLEWGGYKRTVKDWDASILVIDSSEHSAIRGLSNSPDWKLMGIDRKRTIFGLQEAQQNLPQLNRTLNALLFLEWPPQTGQLQLENTIVANSDEAARTVAEVICTTRLPYAALRFIREDNSPQAEKIKTKCYLELAHRVFRHSGIGSELDQFRAVTRYHKEKKAGLWTTTEIGQTESSIQNLTKNSTSPSNLNSSLKPIETALLSGDATEAEKLISDLESSTRPFYSCLVESPNASASEIRERLKPILTAETNLPSDIRGDAYFYSGCISLEVGETSEAIEAFRESIHSSPNSQFRHIRNLYLRQLLR